MRSVDESERAAVTAPLAGRREWIGLAVLALPCVLYSMDLTVLHLAIPSLSTDLQPSSSQLLWIVDIYGFLIAGFLITMGTLGDRIGRRRLLMIGAVGFGIASLLAAFSTSAETLIASRALLGVAAATLAPSTLSLIRNMFHDPRQRTFAIGVWITSFSAGAAIGPLVGGLLLEFFWWGSVFLLAVPVMVLLLVVGPRLLPEFRDPAAGRLDLFSAAGSLISVLAVIYGLKRIAEDGIGWLSIVSILAGLAVGVAFVQRQRHLADPLIDLRLFRVPAFSAALVTNTLAFFVAFGMSVFIAQYLQLVLGLSPLEAGAWSVPSACGYIVGAMLAPVMVRWVRPAWVMAGGLVLAGAGFALLTQVDGQTLAVVVTGSVVFALGLAPVFTLATDLIVGAAPPERAGAAAGIAETSSEFGGAFGIAILGAIGTAVYRGRVTDEIPVGVPPGAADASRDTLGGALDASQRLPDRLAAELMDTAGSAFTYALQLAAAVSVAIVVGAAILAVVLLRRVQDSSLPDGPDLSLRSYSVSTSIAVSDMHTAREFYERKLGLTGDESPHDGSRLYRCGGGTSLHVYPAPAHAGASTATLATWKVADLDAVVDHLRSHGVSFERYDDSHLQADERGIHTLSDGKVAWFKDADGNTFAVEQWVTAMTQAGGRRLSR